MNLAYDESLSSPKCQGRGNTHKLYCQLCNAMRCRADCMRTQIRRRHPVAQIDIEEQEDDYSPYLIHYYSSRDEGHLSDI